LPGFTDQANMQHARHEYLPSPAFGRGVHLWSYGYAGVPVIAFPTAGGYAHEWQQHGIVGLLGDWLAQGRIRLYCPETNAAEVWVHPTTDVGHRMRRHMAYEQFVTQELMPRIHRDTGHAQAVTIGASVGAMYAVNMGLKYPWLFRRAIGLSGRYQARSFTDGQYHDDLYFSDPLSYAWNLGGEHLHRIRQHSQITLVCGQGAHEGRCLTDTRNLARALQQVGAPVWLDLWGKDVSHDWSWWQRQIRYHLGRELR
jgi:esterase/lipase superfamily enzyme